MHGNVFRLTGRNETKLGDFRVTHDRRKRVTEFDKPRFVYSIWEKVVNHSVKFSEHLGRMSSTVERGVFSRTCLGTLIDRLPFGVSRGGK